MPFFILCLLLLIVPMGQVHGDQPRVALPKSVNLQPSPPESSESFQLKEGNKEESQTTPSQPSTPSPQSSPPPPKQWQVQRAETESKMTRSQAPSLSDPPPRSQRAGAGSQGGRSVSLPAPSIKDEEELKSMPKPPVGETDREMPAILLNDTEEPVDNGEETDSGGAVDSGQWGVDGDGTADNRSPPVPDDSEEGYSPSSSSQPSTLNPQPPMTSDSPWTESALMILATVSTLSFLCMLYIADVYRRRWLNALMSQNGLLPGTLPPFGSQNSRTLQDGFYEFPFSTHYDEN